MSLYPFRGRNIEPGQRVRVYKNLHNDKFSLADYSSGLVVVHADFVLLSDVLFQVRGSGQRRARIEGCRNVHAFAVGTFINAEKCRSSEWDEFTYNPFQNDYFVDRLSGFRVEKASKIHMSKGKYLYIP